MSEDDIKLRTMADVEADWQAQNERLDYLGEELDEMEGDAEIDVFHRHRTTQPERVAYLTELVARGSHHTLAMAMRELRLLDTTTTPTSGLELRRNALTRAKRPIQIYPSHYQDRSA